MDDDIPISPEGSPLSDAGPAKSALRRKGSALRQGGGAKTGAPGGRAKFRQRVAKVSESAAFADDNEFGFDAQTAGMTDWNVPAGYTAPKPAVSDRLGSASGAPALRAAIATPSRDDLRPVRGPLAAKAQSTLSVQRAQLTSRDGSQVGSLADALEAELTSPADGELQPPGGAERPTSPLLRVSSVRSARSEQSDGGSAQQRPMSAGSGIFGQHLSSFAGGLGATGSALWGNIKTSFSGLGDKVASFLGDGEADKAGVSYTSQSAFAEDTGEGGAQTGLEERTYNLRRMPYLNPEDHTEDGYWLLRSGMPFPSYHSNPTRDFPARWTLIKGVKDPVEDLRAPRIRLGRGEWERRRRFVEAVSQRALQSDEPGPIHTMNLSYQIFGDAYQYDVLLAFLDANRGIERLALTDNMLVTAQDIMLPRLRELYLSRNQLLTFRVIPFFPLLEKLCVGQNFISSFDGLSHDRWPALTNLTLKGNPVDEHKHYSKKVVQSVPKLQVLDGEPIAVQVKGAFGIIADAFKDEDEEAFQEQKAAAQDVKTVTTKNVDMAKPRPKASR